MAAAESKGVSLGIGGGNGILCDMGAKARLSPVSTAHARPPFIKNESQKTYTSFPSFLPFPISLVIGNSVNKGQNSENGRLSLEARSLYFQSPLFPRQ